MCHVLIFSFLCLFVCGLLLGEFFLCFHAVSVIDHIGFGASTLIINKLLLLLMTGYGRGLDFRQKQ